MSRSEKIFVPVPQEYMGIVIGTGGRNINELKQETDTRITSCKGDNSGKESGFTVTGTIIGCENARLAIRHRIDNVSVTIHEPVPQKFVRLLIRKQGSDNFRVIEKECSVKISWPKFSGREKDVFFTMKGSRSNCERAKEMLKANM
ncbi:vigilin isoform X1, partial [Paramuricea clavata]